MDRNLCTACSERDIVIKKWGLCQICYTKKYDINRSDCRAGRPLRGDFTPGYTGLSSPAITSEMEFAKHFFDHKNWFYHPATFTVDGFRYTPDFYDGERNVFIEIAGSRQAYSQNKEKYIAFNNALPKIKFEIRNSKGTLIAIGGKYTDA
jgi:hypothetical protein